MSDIGLELRLLRVATRIKDLVCESQTGMTEKEIRTVVGDNVGTGKALRSLISQGHLTRIGRGEWRLLCPPVTRARRHTRRPGGSGDPYVYEAVPGFKHVPVITCEQGPQLP